MFYIEVGILKDKYMKVCIDSRNILYMLFDNEKI